MAITSIVRDLLSNYIVRVTSSDTLAQVSAANYVTAQIPNTTALNHGAWQWQAGDTVLIQASDGNSFFGFNGNNFSTFILNQTAANTLAALGIHSATASVAGGSATSVISDSAIAATNVVLARFQSSTNPASVQTVLAGAGTLTVVSNTAPGASVIEYIAYTPSTLLSAEGIVVGKGSYAGGSASFTIADANVVSGMVVNANYQSQANPSIIQSVVASAGLLSFVTTANPGASVIEYSAMLPSIAVKGLDVASSSNAGGSATVVISDANITASSIVSADFKSQANASVVQKVTPSLGTLTLLTSADPGASVVDYVATAAASGGTFLLATNNLSDVASAATSLANLGGLALAGGQMTGKLLLERGTATSTAGAATSNTQLTVITTEALTTAAASAYAFTFTNSRILATSVVIISLMGGTNTTRGIEVRAIPGAGSATLSFFNNNVAASALNGTLIFGVTVL
jgi:hypothetical protein